MLFKIAKIYKNLEIEIPEGLSNNLMVKKFKIDESVENIRMFFFEYKFDINIFRKQFRDNFGY
jgi:hypothetical protein